MTSYPDDGRRPTPPEITTRDLFFLLLFLCVLAAVVFHA